jgi:ribose 5-phosphate isomerase B
VPRPVLTAQDLEKVADGGEISISPDTLITPLARDTAEQRRITIRVEQPKSESASSNYARVVALGADHGGYALKEQLKNYLRDWGYTPLDLGTSSTDPVDYPDFAEVVANAVVRGDAWRGVVVDSAGIGSAIAANKVPGARAAVCYDRASAKNSREHNDANILTLGAKTISEESAREILATWLATNFAAGRHQKRIDKIRAIEARHQIGRAQ